MHGERRFSQAISEGDGISLVAEVDDADAAETAASEGADALCVRGEVSGLPAALPVLWRSRAAPQEALNAGADAYVLVARAAEDDDARLERLYGEGVDLGLDCVVEVRDDDELRHVLEQIDPEIFLLSGNARDGDPLEHVLELLPDLPAGKLAVAEVAALDPDGLDELERAGVDAVLVGAQSLAGLGVGRP